MIFTPKQNQSIINTQQLKKIHSIPLVNYNTYIQYPQPTKRYPILYCTNTSSQTQLIIHFTPQQQNKLFPYYHLLHYKKAATLSDLYNGYSTSLHLLLTCLWRTVALNPLSSKFSTYTLNQSTPQHRNTSPISLHTILSFPFHNRICTMYRLTPRRPRCFIEVRSIQNIYKLHRAVCISIV